MNVEIRSLRRDELEEAWQLHEKGFPYLDEISKEDYLCLRSDPNFDLNQIVIADFDSKLVGKIEVYLWLPPEGERAAYIDGFVVDPAHRRRDIGTYLLLEAEERAKRQGANQLELGVKTFSEAAIALYEKLGYEKLHRVLFMKISLAKLRIPELPNNIRVRFADSSQDLEELLKMDRAVWWNKTTRGQLQREVSEGRESFLVLESNSRIQAFFKIRDKKGC